MKRHLLIVAIAFIGLTLNSCVFNFKSETVKGDGNVVTREYTINNFNEFVCALPATVNFSIADHSLALSVWTKTFWNTLKSW